MNFINRAFLSITRNLGKTTLLLLIVLVLGIVMSGAISVHQAMTNVHTNFRAQLPPVVTVDVDIDELERFNRTGTNLDYERLRIETMHEIGSLPYVKGYNVSVIGRFYSKEIENFSFEPEFALGPPLGDWNRIAVQGVQGDQLLDVEEGLIEIISGRTFTHEETNTLSYVAVISENFANTNGLQLGSVFALKDVIWDTRGIDLMDENFFNDEENIYAQRSYDFEVVGIFRTLVDFDLKVEEDGWISGQELPEDFENRIYAPNTVVVASNLFVSEVEREIHPEWAGYMSDNPEDYFRIENIFVLNDVAAIDDFRAAVSTMIPEVYAVFDAGDGDRNFRNATSSMESIAQLSSGVLWIAIAATVIILSLLISLFLRERRHEIGIYLALGEKRAKVIAQTMTEIMAIALVAIILSLVAGNVIAASISEVMLRNDLVANYGFDHYRVYGVLEQRGFITNAPPVDDIVAIYDVSLDPITIGLFFAAAIATTITASIIPMLYIVKLNPKKIML